MAQCLQVPSRKSVYALAVNECQYNFSFLDATIFSRSYFNSYVCIILVFNTIIVPEIFCCCISILHCMFLYLYDSFDQITELLTFFYWAASLPHLRTRKINKQTNTHHQINIFLFKQYTIQMIALRLTHSLRKATSPMLGQRFMSVINISDMDATTKFQEVNQKVSQAEKSINPYGSWH